MVDPARAVFAVADGDHSRKPGVALVGRLKPRRWTDVRFIKRQPLALGQTLAAIRRVPEEALRVIVNENAIVGAQGGANIHAAYPISSKVDPIAAARQH